MTDFTPVSALAGGGLFILPSLAVIIALSWIYMAYGETAAVGGIVRALGGAVIADDQADVTSTTWALVPAGRLRSIQSRSCVAKPVPVTR